MKNRIAVVGSGQIASLAVARLVEMGHQAAIVTPKEAKNISFEPEPIPYTRAKQETPKGYMMKVKPKCKGRHQYNRVLTEYPNCIARVEWICKCGRKL